VQYFDESLPFRRDTDFATTHLTGISQLHYSLAAGTASGINGPLYLQHLKALADFLFLPPLLLAVDRQANGKHQPV